MEASVIMQNALITGVSSVLLFLLLLLVTWKLCSRAITRGAVKELEVRSPFFVVRLKTTADDETPEGGLDGNVVRLENRRRRSRRSPADEPELPP
jgi:Na+-transporting methylmalonyl-CoA/oxaloacetate decarboxylase gamma subunit